MSQKLNQYNKYGFISGGALFDMLDRFALRKINSEYPETDSQNWFTASAEVSFFKQACPGVSLQLITNYIDKKDNIIYIDVEARNEENLVICNCCFSFKLAKKNFCSLT